MMIKPILLGSLFMATAQAQDHFLPFWADQLGSVEYDAYTCLAADPGGDVFAGGYTAGDPLGLSFGDTDGLLVRYDDSGARIWSRALGTSDNDVLLDLSSDGSGGVYIAGRTAGSYGGPLVGSADGFVARFDGSGNELWIVQIGSDDFDAFNCVESDGAGGVWFAGGTLGDVAGQNAGNFDAFLGHIDVSGGVTWIRQFGTPHEDGVDCLRSDGVGGFFAAGRTRGDLAGVNAGGVDLTLSRYDGLGNPLWQTQMGSSSEDVPLDLAVRDLNEVYICGLTSGDLFGASSQLTAGYVARFDGTGSLVWGRRFAEPATHAANNVLVEESGGVLVVGSQFANAGIPTGIASGRLTSFDAQGTPGATYYLQSDDSVIPRAAVRSKGSRVLVSGATKGSFGGVLVGSSDAFCVRLDPIIGNTFCGPSTHNSSGLSARIVATGSALVANNDLRLTAFDLPLQQFGIFLAGTASGFVSNPGGSQGNLCLGGALGRYNASAQILHSGSAGRFELELDLLNTPSPLGPVPILVGETWFFQAWVRDQNPGATSNFTEAVSVMF